MKVNMTHNDNIKTFDDIACHLELEDECLQTVGISNQAYVIESNSKNSFQKRKWKGRSSQGKKAKTSDQDKPKTNSSQKGKQRRKKDISKVKCYNCGQKGYFAWDCVEPKKVVFHSTHVALVSSCIMMADTCPSWIVDSTVTDHVVRDHRALLEYHWILEKSRRIFVGNNAKIEVKGLGTCQLQLRAGRTLLIYDVLFAPSVIREMHY